LHEIAIYPSFVSIIRSSVTFESGINNDLAYWLFTMLKKSTIILASCSGVPGVYSTGLTTSSTSSYLDTTRKPLAALRTTQYRTYAIVSNGHSRHQHDTLPWPEIATVDRIPTPYQIFGQKKGASYSKKRFYELVKLYHPDRHDPDDGIPYSTKLERYRLVVAANDLLCDPVKRWAYDCYGAGWNGQPEVTSPRDSSNQGKSWGSYSGHGWSNGRGGPSRNATWEDWEKWYNRDSQGKQEPTYFSNSAFVSLIALFAALGGIGQATRAGNMSTSFLEKCDALHDDMSKELMRRRKETNTYSSREDRIQGFLKQRDPYGYGLTGPHDGQHRNLLPPPEVFSRSDTKERPQCALDTKEESSRA
jgi:curved DNA-binding protein CbpA